MVTEVELTFNIRMLFVADDGREFDIPEFREWFFRELPKEVQHRVLFQKGSELDRKLCKQLWDWIGRTDRPPKRLRVYLNREDVKRTWSYMKV